MSGAKNTALTFLATGSALALGGLLLVIGNMSNTPRLFIVLIAAGVVLGFVGLLLLPFAGRRIARGGPGDASAGPDFQQQEMSTAPPATRRPAILLATIFLIVVGLIAGFFYFVVRYLGDMTMF